MGLRSRLIDPAVRRLRRHPILCLFLMTPGFAEYTSGSSSFVNLLVDPPWFVLQLAINAAMYTSGALLVREAMIRWNKGWPTGIALGAAYAIMEEGIADNTIFTPSAAHAPLGAPGVYGYFVGVDWTWLPDVFVIHILMSITIPIVLLGYALPETRGKSLLSDRQVALVLVVLAVDTAILTALVATVTHYWYGLPLLLAAIASIFALCGLARGLPRTFAIVRPGPPTASRRAFYLIGALLYPAQVLLAVLGSGQRIFPPVIVLTLAAVPVLGFTWFARHIGTEAHEREFLAFAIGVLTLGILLGLVLEFPVEIVALFDAAILYFFYRLDRSFAHRTATPGPSVRGTGLPT